MVIKNKELSTRRPVPLSMQMYTLSADALLSAGTFYMESGAEKPIKFETGSNRR